MQTPEEPGLKIKWLSKVDLTEHIQNNFNKTVSFTNSSKTKKKSRAPALLYFHFWFGSYKKLPHLFSVAQMLG